MKKMVCICMAVLMAFTSLAGCSAPDAAGSGNGSGTPAGKVVVNFEGTVAAINGSEITLEDGKIVVISSDTVFAGDPDTGNTVSEEMVIGNFIQGYTADDPDAEKVAADKIYSNQSIAD